jgi:hypothetical protein
LNFHRYTAIFKFHRSNITLCSIWSNLIELQKGIFNEIFWRKKWKKFQFVVIQLHACLIRLEMEIRVDYSCSIKWNFDLCELSCTCDDNENSRRLLFWESHAYSSSSSSLVMEIYSNCYFRRSSFESLEEENVIILDAFPKGLSREWRHLSTFILNFHKFPPLPAQTPNKIYQTNPEIISTTIQQFEIHLIT